MQVQGVCVFVSRGGGGAGFVHMLYVCVCVCVCVLLLLLRHVLSFRHKYLSADQTLPHLLTHKEHLF
jgi:hypothetical protein